MNNFFRYDPGTLRRSLLDSARTAALTALQQYELEWKNIRFIQLSETVTFKIETVSQGDFLLRIHAVSTSQAEIRSELSLLNALHQAGLTVPLGIPARHGAYILEIASVGSSPAFYVTLMRWVEGEHAGGELTDQQAYNTGVLMGKLHEVSGAFAPPSDFIRPVWGSSSFKEELDRLGQHYSSFLTEEAWSNYQAAAAKVLFQLGKMSWGHHNYGLIHGDLHGGNIVFKGDEPYPIDFGRCGYGCYLYDMAGALLGLSAGHRTLFMEGYEAVRRLDDNVISSLECFFIMVMIGNYSHHAPDPGETEGLIGEQPYAQAYIREFLHERSFLLQEVEPLCLE